MIDIPSLLQWSEVKQITTRNGLKPARVGFPTEQFWEAWRANKDELRSGGVSCFEDGGKWVAAWWGDKELKRTTRLSVWTAGKLREYQVPLVEEGVYSLQHGANSFLNASGMGSGKTFCAAAMARELNLRPIVLARKSALNSPWREVLKIFGFKDSDVTVTNPELIRYGKTQYGKWIESKGRKKFQWSVPDDSILIWDEVHNASGFDFNANKPSQLGDVLCAAREQSVRTIALSATAANSPVKMFALGYILGLHQKDDFYQFCYAHGCTVEYGMQFTCGLNFEQRSTPEGRIKLALERQKVMRQIHDKIFKTGKGCRIQSSDIPGFPDNTIIPMGVDFSEVKKINAIYKEMEKELKAMKSSRSPEARAVMVKAQQKAELLMVPEIVEEALNAVEEGMSVPIFVTHRETVKAIAERLKTSCIVIGQQPTAERDRSIRAFQSDQDRYIVNTMGAGSESVSYHDLHGNFPRQPLVVPGFWAEMICQALGRTPRQGAKSKVVQKILFGLGTIQEEAYHNLLDKQQRIAAFNGELSVTDEDLQSPLGT